MKRISKSLLALFLTVILISNLNACGKASKEEKQIDSEATVKTQESEKIKAENSGVWQNAAYQSDTELGQGAKKITVEVKAENKTVKFTIHTDEKTVGEALFANDLIDGENGPYGLYIKKVNGITADYDIDKSYWAFYINGQYAATGADKTDITEGETYQFEYTK